MMPEELLLRGFVSKGVCMAISEWLGTRFYQAKR
jgi:hypothetical protein